MQMNRLAASSLLALSLSNPPPIEGAAILVTDQRTVGGSAMATSGGYSSVGQDFRDPSAPFAPFNYSAEYGARQGTASATARVGQNSSLTPSLFSGSGAIELTAAATGLEQSEGGGSLVDGQSVFGAAFTLLEPHTFDLSGLLSVEGGGLADFTWAFFQLDGPASFFFGVDPVPGSLASLPVAHSGTLPPGFYNFLTWASSRVYAGQHGPLSSSSGVEFSVEFLLSEAGSVPEARSVPEPELFLLTGLALAAVVLKR